MVEHALAQCLHCSFSLAVAASRTVLPKEEARLKIYISLQHACILYSFYSRRDLINLPQWMSNNYVIKQLAFYH
jgi:hypothetical protein